jgi:hypothetical protein
MTLSKKQFNILFLAGISFILVVSVFKSIDFLVGNKYIVESFQQSPQENNSTSNTVDLPLNTTTSCTNFCSPTARCAITGQQCLADIDCPGCQPNEPASSNNSECIPGDDAAGKLTVGTTPTYSTLTTDMGTRATTFTRKKFSKAVSPNYGVNIWMSKYKEENNMFKQRYTPSGLQYMPSYPERYSLTGDFIENGPLPSNSFLK